jgi:AraC-like DNA-binding protein
MARVVKSARTVAVPAPTVREALRRPGTARLLVTQAGFDQEGFGARATHHFFPEAVVLLCLRGRGTVEQAGRRHSLRAGLAALFWPGEPRIERPDPEDPWAAWWLHVTGADLPELLVASGFSVAEPVRELPAFERAVTLVTEVVDALEHDVTQPSLLEASGSAWHLIALLASAGRPAGLRDSPLDSVRDHIRDRYAESISIEDLARRANLSTSHFAALFRRRFGVSPIVYQTHVRMARSRSLLDSTELSVAEVARAVGYDDPSYFGRRFIDAHGMSPRAYRSERDRRRFSRPSDAEITE